MKTNLKDDQITLLEKPEITCADVANVMGDYVDKELTQGLFDRIDFHIHSCKFCKEFETSYRGVIQLASELSQKPIPDGVRGRLRAALNRRLGLDLSVDGPI